MHNSSSPSRPLKPFPTKKHPLIFQTWMHEQWIMTLGELKVSQQMIVLTMHFGHRIVQWEYLRRKSRS